ncbi:helix-turn-helix transcriptional regulator [Azospirillum soli]|uniref:helix-turn-helix transcriptional regulator n=1 Tax=Azospirillum soli TaxID=1304799 RepID=UPI001AE75FF2|nr:LuxR family transcriptional regulator [Azospirillum soli]MBP2315555.1 DNA-binding CsgD family transcriptional regulator [Azospirillum soli]
MHVSFLDEIASLDSCDTAEDITKVVDAVAHRLGFSGFSYLDVRMIGPGTSSTVTPYYLSTARADFVAGYAAERLYEVDPVAHAAKTLNVASSWSELVGKGRRSAAEAEHGAGAERVMGFALDHGYKNGLTIPFHGVSETGAPISSLTTLFWSEAPAEFDHLIATSRFSLHTFSLYCNDKVAKIRGCENTLANDALPSLTNRERDCLSWSAQGKTSAEVSIIMGISENTVNFHLKNAMRKLSVHTKSHAVARAITLGLIAP